MKREIFHISGMTCTGCETRIENVLKKLDGIIEAKAIYSSSSVYVTYDVSIVDANKIVEAIEKLDYKVTAKAMGLGTEPSLEESIIKQKNKQLEVSQFIGILIIAFAIYFIIKNTIGFNFIPNVDQSMGYGLLFVVGLLTSLHCIAMCGGINLSVCVKSETGDKESVFSNLKPTILYNLGRILSYTVIGGIAGVLGATVSFSGAAKGVISILAGILMMLMGLNMLSFFPILKKLIPKIPGAFGNNIRRKAATKGPFIVGILNGFMPCGPLQAMQIYALGTGGFIAGATSMLAFSLGTVPLMFGIGAFSTLMSSKFKRGMLKVSGLLVIILGVIMLSRGLKLSGVNAPYVVNASNEEVSIAKIENGVQRVTIELKSGSYKPIIVQRGIPVEWIIRADKENLNGCNNAITSREFNIDNKQLKVGDNLVEFIPKEEGDFVYTCWMGMISSNIKVVADITKISDEEINSTDEAKLGENWSEKGTSPGGCCRP